MSHIDKVAITPFHSLDRYPNLKILEDFKDEKPAIFTKVSLPPERTTTVNMKEFVRFSFSPNPFVFIVFILFLFLFYILFLVCYRPSWSSWTKFRPEILSGKEMQMAKCFILDQCLENFLKIWRGFSIRTTRKIIFLEIS